MAEPFLGQIEMFAFNFAPRNWMLCDGQLLSITQYQALFSLLGTTFGGDGRTTFALPNMQASVAIGQGSGPGLTPRSLGQAGGAETHTLTVDEIPQHTHSLAALATADTSKNAYTPDATMVLATTTGKNPDGAPIPFDLYVADPEPDQALAAQAIGSSNAGMSHANVMPSLGLSFCIAVQGIYPPRN